MSNQKDQTNIKGGSGSGKNLAGLGLQREMRRGKIKIQNTKYKIQNTKYKIQM